MTDLDKKRKQLEYSRVQLAKQELELKIEERLDEIERLKEHIKIQIKREEELKKELNNL